jgi:hypothetical protein
VAKWIIIVLGLVLVLCLGCNMVKDTAKTGEKGGQGAAGIAEKMKGGTVGDTNEDTGESSAGDTGGE